METTQYGTRNGGTSEGMNERAKEVAVANKKTLRWSDLGLRVLGLVLTLVAAIVVGVDKQTKVVSVQVTPSLPPLYVPVTSKWHWMSAFVYFVVVNAIACAYAALSLILALANRGRKKGLALMIITLDLVMVALLFSGIGATTAIGVIGYKGNSHARWNKVCNTFGKFCAQVAAGIGISLVASQLFLLLVFLAALNLHKRK